MIVAEDLKKAAKLFTGMVLGVAIGLIKELLNRTMKKITCFLLIKQMIFFIFILV